MVDQTKHNGQFIKLAQITVSIINEVMFNPLQKAMSLSKNIAGPAVYYPPGHENFARKDEAAAYQQAGVSKPLIT